MRKEILILIIILTTVIKLNYAQSNYTEVQIQSTDELTITGNLYLEHQEDAPFIILFHQARFSRGEYIETAPKFNTLGYNCLSIDQRSGKEVNNIQNKTNIEATKKGLKTEYLDAMPDLEAAINYVTSNYNPEKLIILGSSYSASLSIILASKYPDKIDAAIVFSPGEYFLFEDKKIEDFAANIKIPVFITSAKSEVTQWKGIIKNIPENYQNSFKPQVDGIHGSRALWEKVEGNETYWTAIKEFLSKL